MGRYHNYINAMTIHSKLMRFCLWGLYFLQAQAGVYYTKLDMNRLHIVHMHLMLQNFFVLDLTELLEGVIVSETQLLSIICEDNLFLILTQNVAQYDFSIINNCPTHHNSTSGTTFTGPCSLSKKCTTPNHSLCH